VFLFDFFRLPRFSLEWTGVNDVQHFFGATGWLVK
jgi:hypothetical protein